MHKSLLVTLDFPPRLGGVAAYYNNICANLPSSDIMVLVPKKPNASNFDSNQPYKILRLDLISKNFFVWPRWWPAINKIKKIVAEESIKNLLVGQILPLGTVALYLKQFHKIPYCVFCHGLDINQLSGHKKILAKKILVNADKIIVNSKFTKIKVLQYGVLNQNIVVAYPCPNPLPSVNEKQLSIIQYEYDLFEKKILLTVGRLVKRKNHQKIIESLPEILKQFPNLVYIIAGDGPEKNNLISAVKKLNLQSNVVFAGEVSDLKLSGLFQLCDVFIMPSKELQNGDVEGFGIVYLEANLAGKPVIGGKSGGVPEAVADGYSGLLVNPENTAEITNAILKLLSDESLAQRLGLQGQHRALEEFSWEKETEKIKELLN